MAGAPADCAEAATSRSAVTTARTSPLPDAFKWARYVSIWPFARLAPVPPEKCVRRFGANVRSSATRPSNHRRMLSAGCRPAIASHSASPGSAGPRGGADHGLLEAGLEAMVLAGQPQGFLALVAQRRREFGLALRAWRPGCRPRGLALGRGRGVRAVDSGRTRTIVRRQDLPLVAEQGSTVGQQPGGCRLLVDRRQPGCNSPRQT